MKLNERFCCSERMGVVMMAFLSFVVVACLLPGCAMTAAQPPVVTQMEYKRISAEEAYRMMAELDDFILLDVRTEEEFEEIRIDGAVLIPDSEIRTRAEAELIDKDIVILVYCRSGRRSENAARALIEMGYANVYDFGGIIDWPYGTASGGQ